jgi:restriction system protein
MSKSYYRIMLGRKSIFAETCFAESFIGAYFDIKRDLTESLTEDWREFNREMIPEYLEQKPEKPKVAAGLACGALWTISKGLQKGDIVLCPDGKGSYWVGKIASDYYYQEGKTLPHRRRVSWYPKTVERSSMSDALRNSTGSIGTVSNVTKYANEIELLITGQSITTIYSSDSTVEDASSFALEKHLEDFLVQNWNQTEISKKFDIFEDGGELVGQQYPTDTGPIDILAISKDKKELLVVELKKGRAVDSVVGQIQRYMGFVKEELAEEHQVVRGIIIALEDDLRIKRALSVAPNIEFYRYKVTFQLFKGVA